MAETEIVIREVRTVPTQSGNTRYVLVDDDGREYSTFREEIGASLDGGEGRRARIRYHEQQRGRFTNVYLDAVELLGQDESRSADEVAWQTAVEAAPYLLRKGALERETSAEEVFEKLRPFKELVADDIESAGDEDEETGDESARSEGASPRESRCGWAADGRPPASG